MKDYLVRGSIEEVDPKLYELIKIEEERQYRRLILIPSESMTPKSIRRALGSGFHNIYAEGYSFDLTGGLSEEELFDYDKLLTLGIAGLRKEIQNYKEKNKENKKTHKLYDAMKTALDLFSETCLCFAEKAKTQYLKAGSGKRKEQPRQNPCDTPAGE